MGLDLKALFNNNSLTYEQFEAAVNNAKYKLVDLNEGLYVSKKKYEDDLASKDNQITTLNDTVSKRDKDLKDLQTKIAEAGNDAEKITSLTNDLTKLQEQYKADKKNYETQLNKQAYEFAVKEFAGNKKFTSNAAKRDFIQSMISKELKMEKGTILGAEDFVTAYSADNADAFVKEDPKPTDPKPTDVKPTFVNPTPGANPTPPDNSNDFFKAFNFTGVRPIEQNK